MISSVGARAGEGAPGVALLPQAAEWFSQYDGDRNWFYVPSPFVFRIAIPLPTEVLANAVTAVLSLYDAFTCRFVPVGDGWQQIFGAAPPPTCEQLELPWPLDGEDWIPGALRTMLTGDDGPIDIETGRLARVAVVESMPGVHHLLIICHHLALDASSWRLIAADLLTFLTDKRLPPRRPPLHDTAAALRSLADAPEVAAEQAHWLSLGLNAGALPPADRNGVPDRIRDVRITRRSLGQPETAALIRTAVRNGLRPGELLSLAGAVGALDVFDNDVIAVDNTIRGRDLPNVQHLREVVGWLSTYAPFVLHRSARGDEPALFAYARAHMVELTGRGHSFGLLKYLSSEATTRARLSALTKPIITCNYVGTTDGMATDASVQLVEFAGFDRLDVDSTPSHPLFITAEVSRQQMTIQLAYSARRFESTTAEAFLDAVHAFLKRSAEL
ncbi:hypothetical protein JCM4814A_00980 [Streptomyces phaeofaciens JCM 4814]|uniref:Condensation domain-containing protein n=1 Tax=Streptomyces phaeofaciens TaxID=68254 RepID=A0A918M114_9ACTN|nr:condensation domain-containing protein [Streptomyces phaeofaciens]GGT92092.1 hypothetical protein GCM10010226_82600 [Streptomyces phaeofaciens]